MSPFPAKLSPFYGVNPATIFVADGTGGLVEKQSESVANSTRSQKAVGGGQYNSVTVKVDSNGDGVIAKIVPVISGQTGRAKFTGEIWILDVRRK
jgi:hypothetical protein